MNSRLWRSPAGNSPTWRFWLSVVALTALVWAVRRDWAEAGTLAFIIPLFDWLEVPHEP